jgi:predicted nuclease of predicted toxin-antitoxin system
VRFLVDESLQRHVADLLVDNGHDAVHVSDIGLRGAVITVETTRIRIRELAIDP